MKRAGEENIELRPCTPNVSYVSDMPKPPDFTGFEMRLGLRYRTVRISAFSNSLYVSTGRFR